MTSNHAKNIFKSLTQKYWKHLKSIFFWKKEAQFTTGSLYDQAYVVLFLQTYFRNEFYVHWLGTG